MAQLKLIKKTSSGTVLPTAGFMWDTLDLGNAESGSETSDLRPHTGLGCCRGALASQAGRVFGLIARELYTLLNENYVEDDDNMFAV